ncbi:B9 domain-containing protein 2 [Trichoplax sp. H2]|uniref:B9 domain-containing protein 2 n=1 Tax=Trichoplax adhaerens TaxID=10228 RepID=B3RKM0_TRIAD|nr:hypothetical protein TRIADDRAFT_52819 [Trichoplax adhaerens]EDV29916.1 hypothetical protein TRIADDRAFT_52819 [Trichoplax adhaerens]RDD39340.1 B9 domain-containing protein 2 [Trichoplax sp. H2]|eukprot:XP_002109118.1 hypothetical protein TRIADDRAFT_52819 [Trichoplax adhaerens]
MAEVHIIGEIIGATGFPSNNLYCKWSIHTENAWRLLEGNHEGQTQVDNPQNEEFAIWDHPIDVHYATKSLYGWPKMYFEVWHQDRFGRHELYGYGFCNLPTSPGTHDVECVTWRPTGTFQDQLRQVFVGGGMEIKDPSAIYTSTDRCNLHTEAMGTIRLQLGIILRHFDKYGVEY